jgi:curved DNA-binding protein CbpA
VPQDPSKTPKPRPLPPGKTLLSYPLAPVDGFVLSRIDGTLSVKEIVTLTGLDQATVEASIAKLASLELVELGTRPPGPRSKPPPPGAKPERSPSIPPRPVTEVSDVLESGAPRPKPALYDPHELDENVDLERDHRRKILDAYYRLSELDLYQVLGVERAADKKTIKRAYYDLAAVHHPDRFFRKRLGSFKQKMEAVFSRVTEAHDILTDKEKRGEYDAYLGAQSEAKAIEEQMARRSSSPGMDRAERAATQPAPPVSPVPPADRPSGIQLSEQARRDALARRLLGGRSSPPRAPSQPAPPPVDPDALRRHYEQKISAVRDHLLREHVANAQKAVAASDWVAATNYYRLALQMAPDDEALKEKLNGVQRQANVVLSEAYRKQAVYEEKAGKTAEAAVSWQRVVKIVPEDVEALARAAACLLSEGTELRTAANLAQRAVTLEPEEVKHRVMLVEIYLAGGLTLNAKRELEAAARLAPGDANIEALMKRAGKG